MEWPSLFSWKKSPIFICLAMIVHQSVTLVIRNRRHWSLCSKTGQPAASLFLKKINRTFQLYYYWCIMKLITNQYPYTLIHKHQKNTNENTTTKKANKKPPSTPQITLPKPKPTPLKKKEIIYSIIQTNYRSGSALCKMNFALCRMNFHQFPQALSQLRQEAAVSQKAWKAPDQFACTLFFFFIQL